MKLGLVSIVVLLGQLSFAQQGAQRPAVVARPPVSVFVGVWMLDVSKSTFDAGQQLTSQIRTYEPFGDGQRGTIESIDATGKRIEYGLAARFDGRYYPMTGSGMPSGADSITIGRVDDHTITASLQKAGREVMQANLMVSDDGKVLTIRRTGSTNAVLVFDKRQSP